MPRNINLTGLSFRLATGALLVAAIFSLSATQAFAAWETPGAPTAQQIADSRQNLPAPGITATMSNAFFKVTAQDVGNAVAEQLQQQGVVPKAEAILTSGSPTVLYSADHALQVVIHALQVDPSTKRWQAQAYIVANGKTETVKPVAGTYGALVDVPVLIHQVNQHDVIEANDITMRTIPERQLRKDNVTDIQTLIGMSPRSAISAQRPIRQGELTQPILVKRGEAVEMTYTSPYMHIRATGIALEDGAKGELIRVKNDKSAKAVSGRVESSGHIEVNSSASL